MMSKKLYLPVLAVLFLFGAFFTEKTPNSEAQSVDFVGNQTLIRFSEDFDSVTVPQLPNGWTVSSTGMGAEFVTTDDTPESSPNAAFSASPPNTSSASLISPTYFILGSNTLLNFRHRYVLENTWDGAVLEIKIGNGNFVDILDAGGEFITGGYRTVLNPSTNVLQNRRAWSGANQGLYESVSVRLPEASFRQNVQFRWRIGTNDNFGLDGWKIDTISLEEVPTGLNTNTINIADDNPAFPYPSEINISGLEGLVTGIVVNIENFSHTSPDDVDILLVSPTGRSMTLMSDVGGNTSITNQTLSFDDKANSNLPDDSEIVSGVYKPTNSEGVDFYPTPAPQQVPSDNLGSFFGDEPNGTWSLFVVDDSGLNSGSISSGWNLSIQSSVNACFFTVDPLFASFSHIGGSNSFEISSPIGCPWTTTINNEFISFDSTNNNTLTGTGSALISYSVGQNLLGSRTGLMTVTDGFSERTFQIQQSSGCPFSLNENSLNVSSNEGTASVSVEAGENCVWNATTEVSWIEVTSDEQTGNGTATFNISSNNTGIARSGLVTIGARTFTINQLATSSSVKFDFDGDGRSDISVYRDGLWYLLQSTQGFSVTQFGLSTDVLTPADFDGDGKTDISVFRDGVWYILRSSDAQFSVIQYGQSGDIPTPADFDNDGKAELVVYRNGTWFTNNLASQQTSVVQFGIATDKPVVADYDGDGSADYAVYRDGIWYLLQSTNGFTAAQFGIASDIPVVGDYDGDGKSDLAVYRSGIWHILANLQNYSAAQFGIATDIPVSADYDGDGKSDLAIFRDGTWYVFQSSNSQASVTQFGFPTDKPVPNAFVP